MSDETKEELMLMCFCSYRKIRKSMSKINASFIQELFAVVDCYAGLQRSSALGYFSHLKNSQILP